MPKLIITNNACGLALMNIFDIQTFLVFFYKINGGARDPGSSDCACLGMEPRPPTCYHGENYKKIGL